MREGEIVEKSVFTKPLAKALNWLNVVGGFSTTVKEVIYELF